MGDATISEDARRALDLANVKPARAWKLATDLAHRSVLAHDYANASVAARAAGLAAVHLTNLDTAAQYLRSAVDNARRAGSRRLLGEARMTLAFALTRRGNVRLALRTIDVAMADLTGVERARATAQRGAIRQQLGQLDTALSDYRAALPILQRHADWTWVQRIHSNRGVLFIYRSQLAAAAVELASAEQVCRRNNLELQLALVYDNIAFLHVRKGDVPAALRWLDEAARAHAALGAQAGAVLIDRSELLLTVGLVAEARVAAAQAVDEFGRLRRRILLPQAQLLLADTALLDGDVAAARAAADAACRAFRAQGRDEWVALARYTSLRSRLSQSGGRRVTVRELARVATDLDVAGWAVPALDARLVAARTALATGDTQAADHLLQQANVARRRGPAELRARAWHAEALRRLAEGRPRSAAIALQAGVRVVEDYQATMPATDLRSTVSSHHADLVALGTRLALTGGRAHQVLLWAERGRATALRIRPLRPPNDSTLAQLLVELRATVAAIDEARAADQLYDGLMTRQAALERNIRDRARSIPGPTIATRLPTVQELGLAIGEAALIEFVEQDGALFAVTMVDSRVKLTPIGAIAEVPTLLEQLPFALRLLAKSSSPAGTGTNSAAAMQLLERACRALDQLLLTPLQKIINDRPLVIVPTGALQSVLWSALPSCAHRAVTVTPSAALWHQAQQSATQPGHVTIAAGPDLAAAPAEARRIAKLYDNVRLLLGAAATVNATLAAWEGCSVAHIAAHGRLRADNPLFSSLRMSDGPLTAYDLETMSSVPRLVVLAACDGGLSHRIAGDEVLGLAAGFLAHGTTALIGPLGYVRDGSMEDLMVELHKRLQTGRSPATALMEVRAVTRDAPPATQAAVASLVCLGAGHVSTAHVDPQHGHAAA